LELDRHALAAAAGDPRLRATDAAEALVREGRPFRDAYAAVADTVRSGTFDPVGEPAERPAPGPAGVLDALVAARGRFRPDPRRGSA
jgi:hypothetical protein